MQTPPPSTRHLATLHRVQQGLHVAEIPLGYLEVGKTAGEKVVVDPRAAPLIREAFDLAAHGLSLRQILKVLEERGLRSKYGGKLGVSSLWNILANPFYAGAIRWEGRLWQGVHKPLIPVELYIQVRSRLRNTTHATFLALPQQDREGNITKKEA